MTHLPHNPEAGRDRLIVSEAVTERTEREIPCLNNGRRKATTAAPQPPPTIAEETWTSTNITRAKGGVDGASDGYKDTIETKPNKTNAITQFKRTPAHTEKKRKRCLFSAYICRDSKEGVRARQSMPYTNANKGRRGGDKSGKRNKCIKEKQ